MLAKIAHLRHIALPGWLLLAGYLLLALWANSDSLNTAWLHVDERVTYDGLVRIYESNSVTELAVNMLHGDDHRYGRLHWCSHAVLSAPAWWLGGPEALVLSIRMWEALLLAATYWLLALALIRSAIWRWGLLFVLIALSTTPYYTYMPKPEPLMLFCVALMLWLLQRYPGRLWPCLLGGMAIGLKINALPLIALLVAGSLLWPRPTFPILLRKAAKACLWVVGGFALAEPAALPYFRTWLAMIARMTEHGADNANIGPADWMSWMAQGYFPGWVYMCCWLLALLALLYLGYRHRQPALPVALAGLLGLIAIVVGVDRVWAFYLHPGMVLLLAGAMALAAMLFRHAPRISLLWTALTLCAAAYMLVWQSIPTYAALAHRSSSPDHNKHMAQLNVMRRYEKDLKPGRLIVIEGNLYMPNTRSTRVLWKIDSLQAWRPQYVFMRNSSARDTLHHKLMYQTTRQLVHTHTSVTYAELDLLVLIEKR